MGGLCKQTLAVIGSFKSSLDASTETDVVLALRGWDRETALLLHGEVRVRVRVLTWRRKCCFVKTTQIQTSVYCLVCVCVYVCVPPSLWNMATSRSVAPVWTMFCSRVWRARRFSLQRREENDEHIHTYTYGQGHTYTTTSSLWKTLVLLCFLQVTLLFHHIFFIFIPLTHRSRDMLLFWREFPAWGN